MSEDLFINCSAGIGKTNTTLENLIPKAKNKLIVFGLPTTKNIDEVYEKTLEIANTEVAVWQIKGRSENNCYQIDEVETMANKGFMPGLTVCSTCQHNGICEYQKQFQDMPSTGIITCAHETAIRFPKKANILVLDENPIRAFLDINRVKPGSINQILSKLPQEATEVVQKLLSLSNELLREMHNYYSNPHNQGRIYVTSTQTEWANGKDFWELSDLDKQKAQEKLSRDLAIFSKFADETMRKWQQRLVSFHPESLITGIYL